jgi:hypothetical protein
LTNRSRYPHLPPLQQRRTAAAVRETPATGNMNLGRPDSVRGVTSEPPSLP